MTRHNAASAMLRAEVPMSDITAAFGHRDPNIVSVYLSTDASALAACTLFLPSVGEGVLWIKNDSLRDLIDKFISYKRHNGYVYRTGAYYLKKYV